MYREKQMKHLEHALATCVEHMIHSKYNTNNLQHETTCYNIRLKQLKYFGTFCCNMCVKHMQCLDKNDCNICLEIDKIF
jgi:hypothetical protein